MQDQANQLEDQVSELTEEVQLLSQSLATLRDQVARLERRSTRAAQAARSSGSASPGSVVGGDRADGDSRLSASPAAPRTPSGASSSFRPSQSCIGKGPYPLVFADLGGLPGLPRQSVQSSSSFSFLG